MSLWNKITDIVNPNSEEDKRKRLAQGKSANYVRNEQPVNPYVQQSVQNAKYGVLANNAQKQNDFLKGIRPAENSYLSKAKNIGGGVWNTNKAIYNGGKSAAGSIGNTAQLPFTAGRLGIANLTGNKVAADNARKSAVSDAKNNMFWNDTYNKAGDILAGTVSGNYNLNKNKQANEKLNQTLRTAYGNRPVANAQIDAYTSGLNQEDNQRFLAGYGLTPTSSKTETFKKVGLPIISAGAQTALNAVGAGAGAKVATTGLVKQGLRQQVNQVGKQGIGFGTANAGIAAADTLSAGGSNTDALKAATTGLISGAALPAAGFVGGKVLKAPLQVAKAAQKARQGSSDLAIEIGILRDISAAEQRATGPAKEQMKQQVFEQQRKIQEMKASGQKFIQPINNQIGAVGRNVLPDPLEALRQEARKYKSAEEFVKAQGEPVYHRSQNKFDKFDISKVSNDSNRQRYGWGLYFSDTIPHDQYGKNLYEARLPKGTFIDSKQPVDEKIVSKIAEAVKGNNKNPSELGEFSYNGYLFYKTLSRILGGDKEASLFLSKNGIDGLKSNIGKNANDYILFNDKSISTNQQLTDLYNQSQKKPLFKPLGQGGYVKNPMGKEGAPKNLDDVFNDPDNIGLFEPAQKQANAFQDTLPSKTRPNSVKDVVKGGGTPLYHDTDAKGIMGILDSGTINPSQAPFSQIAGQGKRVSTTRNFDNYSRYHDSPYRLVIDESKAGQKSIPDNREEFESIFNKPVSTKAVQGVAVDITNPALIKDIQNGTFAKVLEKAKQKGITIEPFEGKILPDDAANAQIQKMTKELYAQSGAPIEKTAQVGKTDLDPKNYPSYYEYQTALRSEKATTSKYATVRKWSQDWLNGKTTTSAESMRTLDKDVFPEAISIRKARESDATDFEGIYSPSARVITLPGGTKVMTDAAISGTKLTMSEFAVSKNAQGRGIGARYVNELKQMANEMQVDIEVGRITGTADAFWKKTLGDTSDGYSTIRKYSPSNNDDWMQSYKTANNKMTSSPDTTGLNKQGGTFKPIISQSGAPIEKTPLNSSVKDYADMLQGMESSLKGGQMIGDSTNGYKRISEHTPFYRDYYARNGKAPTKADWQAEAERQLKAGNAEAEFQKAYNDQTNPEVASLLQEADKGALQPSGVVISEAVNKGSGTKVQRGIEVIDGKPQRFERTVASKKLESIAKQELPNISEKPVDLKSIDGRENSPVKQKFLDLTNKYLGTQKAGAFNAVDRAKKFNEQFGNLTEKQKNEVIFATDDPKFGTKDPAVQRAVDYLHAEFDSAYRLFTEDKGLKLNYQQSYYPRQYKNAKTGDEISAAEYNLLQRSSARQKGRTSDSLAEWRLVTRDPAEALVKYYTSLEKAAAGQKYLNGLKSEGLVISSSEPVRGMQPVIAEGMQENGMIYYAKPDVAKQLNKLFGTEKASGFFEKSLEKAQGFNSFMQSFVLSGGVPNTPINAFGVMQLMKNGMALHPIQGGKAFYLGMTRKGADKFFEKNQSYLQDMAKNGLDVRYDYRPQMKTARNDIVNTFKDKGTAQAIATGWDELTNDATFGRFMPALETLHYKGVYDNLVKKMPAEEAAATAAKATANFFGKNTLAKDAVRSKVGRDASGALLFAPRFRESMLNFWVKNAQALKPGNITKPEYRDNVKFMAAAALTYAAMDGINYSANGVHMYQNPDGKKDKLLLPGKDGQYIGVPFLPSIATVPRNAGMGIYNLATGNLNEAGKNAKSFLSIPARAVGDIVTNENYFGAPIVQKGATAGERAAQVGSYLVKNNLQPWIREGLNAAGQNLPEDAKKLLGVKKQTGVQTASQALELPFRFYDSQNFKGGADNFKTADGSTLGATRTANADTRDEVMKAALSTPEAKRFFANSDAKQQELADNDPELQKLYNQRKAMLTGLKSNKIASNNKLTDREQSVVNSWNRLTTEAKNKVTKESPARKKEYDFANAKLQLSMGEIDQEAYDKKVVSLTKTAKKASTGRKSSGGKGKKPTFKIVQPLVSSNYGLVSKAGKGIRAKKVVTKLKK